MSLLTQYDPNTLRTIVDVSDYWARKNNNDYAEALHNALSDLYEYTKCPCAESCTCRHHGCTHHWTLRPNVTFADLLDYFLACYVDANARKGIWEAIMNGAPYKGRARNAIDASLYVRDNFDRLVGHSSRSLLCDDWHTLDSHCEFNIYEGQAANRRPTIYESKWRAFLALDTYIAYDTGSARLLSKDFGAPTTYRNLMTSLRDHLTTHLTMHGVGIPQFRRYDSGARTHTDVPIGVILDKLYLTL